MAEEGGDAVGIPAAVEHAPPGAGQAGQAPPDVEILEQEALNVVRVHDRKYIEHVTYPRWMRELLGDKAHIAMTTITDKPAISGHDQYLFREGTHTRLYEKLGAHVVPGAVRFAV